MKLTERDALILALLLERQRIVNMAHQLPAIETAIKALQSDDPLLEERLKKDPTVQAVIRGAAMRYLHENPNQT